VADIRSNDDLLAAVAQMQRERDEARAERDEAFTALDAPPYVDCICPGCPAKVPHAWVSGMCGPCATEDCEHTDEAFATAAARYRELTDVNCARSQAAAEGDALRAEVKRLEYQLDQLRVTVEEYNEQAQETAALRAVLQEYIEVDMGTGIRPRAATLLAEIAARAGKP
jgi:hypothetical protein